MAGFCDCEEYLCKYAGLCVSSLSHNLDFVQHEVTEARQSAVAVVRQKSG